MTDEIADGTVKTPDVDVQVNWEARAKKAEAKIVDMKKDTSTDTDKEKSEDTSNKEVDLDKKISDLLEAKLSEMNNKDEIKEEDKFIANQNISNSMSIWWDARSNTSDWHLSFDDYWKLSVNARKEYCNNNKNDKWDVIFI